MVLRDAKQAMVYEHTAKTVLLSGKQLRDFSEVLSSQERTTPRDLRANLRSLRSKKRLSQCLLANIRVTDSLALLLLGRH